MRKIILLVFGLTSALSFAQVNHPSVQASLLAPGVIENIAGLLNKPAIIKPSEVIVLGKGWHIVANDAHVLSDEVNVKQVAAVLLDLDNQGKYFNGKKNKLASTVVKYDAVETIVDFITITPILGLQIKTPYRALVKTTVKSNADILLEVVQTESDIAANNTVKNLYSIRYAQTVVINDKTYTYVRFYSYEEVNTSILPGARSILAGSSDAANLEAVQLLITAAKSK